MKYLLFLITIMVTSFSYAQEPDSSTQKPERSPFGKGYLRLGLNMLGSNLDPAVSPFENVKNGNLGAGNGYTLEFGRIFYFLNRKERRMFNAGLDWTILNLTYAQLNKWEDYAGKRNENFESEAINIAASASTKLGPVVVINPVDKLVIEARFQVSYGLHYNAFEYYSPTGNNQGYMLGTWSENYFDSRGVGTSLGATLRYGFFGFAVDWANAKIPVPYYLNEPGNPDADGIEKIPFKHFQLKLSFTF